jgi:hypothetical protein
VHTLKDNLVMSSLEMMVQKGRWAASLQHGFRGIEAAMIAGV